MEQLPKALKMSMSRFPTLRKRLRLNVSSGSTSVDQNGIIRVKLPSQSLIDLSTFQITCTGNITGTNSSDGRFPPTYGLIRRIGANFGGLNVGFDNNEWNQICHAMNLSGNSLEYDKSNCNANMNPLSFGGDGTYLCFNYFPASVMTAGVIDTSVLGDGEIDIQLEGQNALIFVNGAAGTVADWSLSNIRAYVDVLELQNLSYRSTIKENLQNGGSYQKLMSLATVVEQENTNSNSFNIGTQCLDRVMVGVKSSNFKTQVAQAADDLYNRFFNYTAASDASIYFQINSETLPQYGHSENFNQLAEFTRQAMGGASVYNYNKLFAEKSGSNIVYDNEVFAAKNAVFILPVGMAGPACENNGLCSGLDLSGNNSIIRVESTNMNNNDILIMAGLHSSILTAKAGQELGFTK